MSRPRVTIVVATWDWHAENDMLGTYLYIYIHTCITYIYTHARSIYIYVMLHDITI